MTESVRTRLFLPQAGAKRLFTDDPEILEVARVLRLRRGDRVGVFADDPLDYWYVVEKSDRNGLELRMTGKEINPANPVVPCVLFQAHGTAGKAGNIVREAAALGATEVIFFQAERSMGRGSENKIEKLQKVAIESCRQCGRSLVPKISSAEPDFPTALESVRREYPSITFLTLSPKGKEHLIMLPYSLVRGGIALVIGPEGGFSPDEESLLRSIPSRFIHLGRRILRMELAAMASLVMVNTVLELAIGRDHEDR